MYLENQTLFFNDDRNIGLFGTVEQGERRRASPSRNINSATNCIIHQGFLHEYSISRQARCTMVIAMVTFHLSRSHDIISSKSCGPTKSSKAKDSFSHRLKEHVLGIEKTSA